MYTYKMITRKGSELVVSRETMSEAMEFAISAIELAKSLETYVSVVVEKDGKRVFAATV